MVEGQEEGDVLKVNHSCDTTHMNDLYYLASPGTTLLGTLLGATAALLS